MKKFSRDMKDQLTALMLYHLFRKQQALDAYWISTHIGATKIEEAERELHRDKENGALKAWAELGSKVNFCWLEGKGELSELIMTRYECDRLKSTARESYDQIQLFRNKASKRWSNDWKDIEPKIIAAKALNEGKPKQDSLMLTWTSVQAECARKLQQMNKPMEADSLKRISLEILMV